MAVVRSLVSRALQRARDANLIELSVPGTTHTVYARPETSDLAAFEGVFGGAYAVDLPTVPQLILDLGANVGYASVYFALRWPGARVLAVEPEPSNVALLRRNVAYLPQIEVVEGGIWPRPGRLEVEDAGKGYWGMRVRATNDAHGVRAVTVRELLERAGADWVDFVKIDIEGSELELFSEETEWLGAVGALMLELHDRYRPGCREAVEQAIARSGVAFRALYQGGDVLFVR